MILNIIFLFVETKLRLHNKGKYLESEELFPYDTHPPKMLFQLPPTEDAPRADWPGR